MRQLFVDSFYYIALLNPHDAYHERAQTIVPTIAGSHFWTTNLILVEIANALSALRLRDRAAAYIRRLEQSPDTTIVPMTPDLFERALWLYEQRLDKEWSLTDCLSFVVMEGNGITEALTGDHHFEQSGFRLLLGEGATT
jgi:predicted nucleic acid-binding protein